MHIIMWSDGVKFSEVYLLPGCFTGEATPPTEPDFDAIRRFLGESNSMYSQPRLPPSFHHATPSNQGMLTQSSPQPVFQPGFDADASCGEPHPPMCVCLCVCVCVCVCACVCLCSASIPPTAHPPATTLAPSLSSPLYRACIASY